MTRFVFKSLMIAGAFFAFGGHMPLDGDGGAFALPQVSCEADFASCRIGEREVALGDRSPLLAEIAAKAKRAPGEELKQALGDPELVRLLDQQVIPEFAVAAAQMRLAEVANQIIAGIDTGAGQARRAE
jgi:hypothetical protein